MIPNKIDRIVFSNLPTKISGHEMNTRERGSLIVLKRRISHAKKQTKQFVSIEDGIKNRSLSAPETLNMLNMPNALV